MIQERVIGVENGHSTTQDNFDGMFLGARTGDHIGLQEGSRLSQFLGADSLRLAPANVPGSNAFLDLIMNFDREHASLRDFRRQHAESRPWMNESEREREFRGMVAEWIFDQQIFNLTENGCGRHLAIQPTYRHTLKSHEGKLILEKTGLQAFGDHSVSYVRENHRVGDGLLYLYGNLLRMGVGGWAMVMSPTELYRDQGSNTDVLNMMWVSGVDSDGNLILESKYIIPNRVLPHEERRFIHNLFYRMGEMINMDEVRIEEIAVDELWHDPNIEGGVGEIDMLVRRPPLFRVQGENVLTLLQKLEVLFEKRFGKKLVNEREDVTMYMVVNDIVRANIDELVDAIYEHPNRERYYDLMRRMIYTSQMMWARLHKDKARELVTHAYPAEVLGDKEIIMIYLMMMYQGQIMGGFEQGWGGIGGVYESNNWGVDTQQPYGYSEMLKHCKQHEIYYQGTECPKCGKLGEKISVY